MGERAESVAAGGRVSLWLAEQMLKDVKPEIFARKPRSGGLMIDTNHPAFIYGHLSLYASGCLKVAGLDPAAAEVPGAYQELFSAGKACQDDADGAIYPPMAEITGNFFRVYKATIEQIARLDDAKLGETNPREGRMREMFPTVGGMLPFLLNSHICMHVGQASAWRRCFGLGPVM